MSSNKYKVSFCREKDTRILLKMNMILACTAVYGVFAPYTAGGHGILDIQRNSGYTAEFQLWSMSVPHPRLPSHFHLQSPPDQNPVENELPKLEIGLAKLELSI